ALEPHFRLGYEGKKVRPPCIDGRLSALAGNEHVGVLVVRAEAALPHRRRIGTEETRRRVQSSRGESLADPEFEIPDLRIPAPRKPLPHRVYPPLLERLLEEPVYELTEPLLDRRRRRGGACVVVAVWGGAA